MVGAQNQFVEKSARVGVPIFEDNLDDAKSRAVRNGKTQVIRLLVKDMVAENWVLLFDRELNKRIFRRVDRFISNYQVQGVQTSIDRTQYNLIVVARVDRALLADELRALNLPLLSEKHQPLLMYYRADDPVMSVAVLRNGLVKEMTERLEMLNFTLQPARIIRPEDFEALQNPLLQEAENTRLIERLFPGRGVVLSFTSTHDPVNQPNQTPSIRAVARFYQKQAPNLIGQIEKLEVNRDFALPLKSSGARSLAKRKLIDPLINGMIPGAIRLAEADNDSSRELSLRVMGLTSVEEEEVFEREFFKRNSPFSRLTLSQMDGHTVTYRGSFSGNSSNLEESLRGSRVGPFHIRQVFWYNKILELEVERLNPFSGEEMEFFPVEKRSLDVGNTITSFFERYPQLEVEDPVYRENEDNGWLTRANKLPFGVSLYGFLDSRGDSDFYVAEALNPNEEMELVWYRISRTQLSPVLRIYNENGLPVREVQPTTWARVKYKLPKGQHRFYVEVADRFGYIKADTGGYRTFSYLFKVERNGAAKTAAK